MDRCATTLSIVIPFREDKSLQRSAQLRGLLKSLQSLKCTVWVIEQSDDGRRFNRGAALHAGCQLASQEAPHAKLCMHDVDLHPDAEMLREYVRPLSARTVRHLGSAFTRYATLPNYLGGVLIVPAELYFEIGGMPTDFWGWGGEDDEFAARLKRAKVMIEPAQRGTLRDAEQLTWLQKRQQLVRDDARCPDKRERRAAHARKDKAATFDYHIVQHSIDKNVHFVKIQIEV